MVVSEIISMGQGRNLWVQQRGKEKSSQSVVLKSMDYGLGPKLYRTEGTCCTGTSGVVGFVGYGKVDEMARSWGSWDRWKGKTLPAACGPGTLFWNHHPPIRNADTRIDLVTNRGQEGILSHSAKCFLPSLVLASWSQST